MRAIERRQCLLEALCERRFDKIENLAFEFSVNECTIRRDIQELSLSYPIYTRTGTYGGVYIAEDYYLGKQYLSLKQKELLSRLMSVVNNEDQEVLESILNRFGGPNNYKNREKFYDIK